MGSRVHVVEQKERRVRIDQPVGGWCSLHSSTGDTILSRISNDGASETPRAGNYASLSNDIAKLKKQEAAETDEQKEAFAQRERELEQRKKDMEARLEAQ